MLDLLPFPLVKKNNKRVFNGDKVIKFHDVLCKINLEKTFLRRDIETQICAGAFRFWVNSKMSSMKGWPFCPYINSFYSQREGTLLSTLWRQTHCVYNSDVKWASQITGNLTVPKIHANNIENCWIPSQRVSNAGSVILLSEGRFNIKMRSNAPVTSRIVDVLLPVLLSEIMPKWWLSALTATIRNAYYRRQEGRGPKANVCRVPTKYKDSLSR